MRKRGVRPVLIGAALVALLAATSACRRPGNPPGSTVPGNPAVQVKKLRYGPFAVPNINAPGQGGPLASLMPLVGLKLENGMLNLPTPNVEKPCGDCYLTGMQAGLEYADGTQATINRGLWLHHMVLLAQGTGKFDATCRGAALSLPHISVGASPANSERFFASGNERTPADFTRNGSYGYRVNNADRFHLLLELMNLNPTDASVYLTVEYRYLTGNPAGIRPVKPVWLDAVNCGTSEAPAQTGRYDLSSTPWTSTVTGTLIDSMGHVHDGGTGLSFEKSGQAFCTSQAAYGESPEYIDPPGAMDHGGGGMDHGHGGAEHISSMTKCPTGTRLNVGDVLAVHGHYDTAVHPEMMHDGSLHPVMALGLLYYSQ